MYILLVLFVRNWLKKFSQIKTFHPKSKNCKVSIHNCWPLNISLSIIIMKLESVIVQSMDEFHVYYSSKMDKNLQWTAGITLKSKKKKKKNPNCGRNKPETWAIYFKFENKIDKIELWNFILKLHHIHGLKVLITLKTKNISKWVLINLNWYDR